MSGPLAQSVERGADNAKVVSSRLTWTNFFSKMYIIEGAFNILLHVYWTVVCTVTVTLHVKLWNKIYILTPFPVAAFFELLDRGMGIVSLHSKEYSGYRLRMNNFVLEGKVRGTIGPLPLHVH